MNSKAKKVLKIAYNVLVYLLLALCIFLVIVTILSKKDADGAAEVFGYQIRTVITDSMGKSDETDVSGYDIGSIPKDSLVFIKLVPEDVNAAKDWYASVKEGDVLTFKYVYTNSQVTITHRVISSTPNDKGGYTILLEGDNKSATDSQLTQVIHTEEVDSYNYVIGKVVGKSFILGLLITWLKSAIGIVLLVILPCFIVIIFEVIKIFNMMNAEKKQKAAEETAKKDNELLELKKRLAELEALKSETAENSKSDGGEEI